MHEMKREKQNRSKRLNRYCVPFTRKPPGGKILRRTIAACAPITRRSHLNIQGGSRHLSRSKRNNGHRHGFAPEDPALWQKAVDEVLATEAQEKA